VNGFRSPATALQPPIFVVDPDARQRSFVGKVLGRAGFKTQSIASGEEALTAALRERPRLVVLEVRLGDISGYEVCRALKEAFGDAIGIVFVSRDRTEPSDRVAGLLIGADDYLEKPLVGDELLARVRGLIRRVAAHSSAPVGTVQSELTGRELEVLHLLADGLDQRSIARRLFIAPKTVGKHIEHILQKLPARSRAEAVAIAYRRGLTAQSTQIRAD
jgi:two-component system nitrate/nitrite response regulator NarP